MEKCDVCEQEYSNLSVHKRMKHGISKVAQEIDDGEKVEEIKVEDGIGKVSVNLETLNQVLNGLAERVKSLENKGVDIKIHADEADVERAKEGREKINPKIVEIVDDVLGQDFGIEIDEYKDRLGYLFTVVVPPRLSDMPVGQKDKRSRTIMSYESYDAVRSHCEKVKSYLVAYYQKMSKPLPEFRIK